MTRKFLTGKDKNSIKKNKENNIFCMGNLSILNIINLGKDLSKQEVVNPPTSLII